jgi:hypothetical protein
LRASVGSTEASNGRLARVGRIDRSQLTSFGLVGSMRAQVAVANRQEDVEFGGGGVFGGEPQRASGGGADIRGQSRPSSMASGLPGTRRQ